MLDNNINKSYLAENSFFLLKNYSYFNHQHLTNYNCIVLEIMDLAEVLHFCVDS